MAATVEICESNDSTGESITHGVTNLNFGNADESQQVYTDHPIPIPGCSYFKLIRYHVTVAPSNKINNLQVYKSAGAYVTGESCYANTHVTQGSYDTYKKTSYSAPNKTELTGYYALATSDPGSANLGIGGSLTGEITTTGYSDYLMLQLKGDGTAVPGSTNSKTITFEYDEQ